MSNFVQNQVSDHRETPRTAKKISTGIYMISASTLTSEHYFLRITQSLGEVSEPAKLRRAISGEALFNLQRNTAAYQKHLVCVPADDLVAASDQIAVVPGHGIFRDNT